jgi:hypothetical protein
VIALFVAACSVVAAVLAWGLTMAYAAVDAARLREEMARDIRYWQAVAERAGHHAAQLARDATTWAAGHRQGRDDTIAIMSMIVEAEERRVNASLGAVDMTETTE